MWPLTLVKFGRSLSHVGPFPELVVGSTEISQQHLPEVQLDEELGRQLPVLFVSVEENVLDLLREDKVVLAAVIAIRDHIEVVICHDGRPLLIDPDLVALVEVGAVLLVHHLDERRQLVEDWLRCRALPLTGRWVEVAS